MPLRATPSEVERLRTLIEDEKIQQWKAAEILGWNRKQVSYLVRKHGMRTQRPGPRSGPGHPNWNGGRSIDKNGYVTLWMPGHPNARKNGRVLEHRYVMSQLLGRPLRDDEVVHHRNGDKADNRPANLELFEANAEHLRHELTGRVPRWTPEGREAMRRAARAKSRRAQERGASEKQAASRHSTGSHAKAGRSP